MLMPLINVIDIVADIFTFPNLKISISLLVVDDQHEKISCIIDPTYSFDLYGWLL